MDGYIGLGSNLGEPACELRAGISELQDRGVAITARSSFYRTEPVAAESEAWFINAVLGVRFAGTPVELFDICRAVERSRGRERSVRNAPRTLDLDILLIGPLVLESEDLTIPHPRLHIRRFVLVPMVEIAPDVMHPVMGRPMRDLLVSCTDKSAVVRLENATV